MPYQKRKESMGRGSLFQRQKNASGGPEARGIAILVEDATRSSRRALQSRAGGADVLQWLQLFLLLKPGTTGQRRAERCPSILHELHLAATARVRSHCKHKEMGRVYSQSQQRHIRKCDVVVNLEGLRLLTFSTHILWIRQNIT